MNTVENTQEAKTQDSPWEKSSISNLVRWKSSKIYFARVKIGGRLIRKSLDTPLMSVARNRLAELIKQERERAEVATPDVQGKLTFGEAVKIYLERLDGNPDLKPSTKKYRRQCVGAILKTWPGLETTELRKITKPACQEWARQLRQHGTKFRPPGAKKERKGISSSRFNNTITTLRQVLKLGVEMGIVVISSWSYKSSSASRHFEGGRKARRLSARRSLSLVAYASALLDREANGRETTSRRLTAACLDLNNSRQGTP